MKAVSGAPLLDTPRPPMTQGQLAQALYTVARASDGDPQQDLGTLFDVCNDKLSRSGRTVLSVSACLQIAHAVRAEIAPDTEQEPRDWNGDLTFVNQFLHDRRGECDNPETARMVLPRLLQATAKSVEASLARGTGPAAWEAC